MAGAKDKYANLLVKNFSLSAANTLTFDEIEIGLSLFDKVGLKIQRLEYHWSNAALAEMTANGDDMVCGLITSDAVSSPGPSESAVIHMTRIKRIDFGTAASAQLTKVPDVFDFSNLAGGGLLVTPRPLYAFGNSSGLASACQFNLRVFFTVEKLADAEYFELLETRHYFGQ